jgi:hypothetical protein
MAAVIITKSMMEKYPTDGKKPCGPASTIAIKAPQQINYKGKPRSLRRLDRVLLRDLTIP